MIREVDWLAGDRRFPGELRLPDVACIIHVETSARLADKDRSDTRYFISSANLTARQAAEAVRGHWAIENRLHWVLDVVFGEDQSRLRKGHGAKNMAVVRHCAHNLIRAAEGKKSLKTRRKLAALSRSTPPYRTNLIGFGALRLLVLECDEWDADKRPRRGGVSHRGSWPPRSGRRSQLARGDGLKQAKFLAF